MTERHIAPIVPCNTTEGNGGDILLKDLSSKDSSWDVHRSAAERIADLYQGTEYESYAVRIDQCSPLLEFVMVIDPDTGVLTCKLKAASFCRVPQCPVCRKARVRMWRAKAYQMMPAVFKDYPTARFLFLTLTVSNPHVSELRTTLDMMNKAWKRLTERKQFPAIGWIKTVEVTREHQCIDESWCKSNKVEKSCQRCLPLETVHPHFHILLMVPPGYFGRDYLSQNDWTQLWKEALRVNYTPIVNIKAVKSLTVDNQGMNEAVLETFKYSVKTKDILTDKDNASMNNQQFLLEITKQLLNTRAIATGGVLKQYLKELEKEPEDLIHADVENDENGDKLGHLLAAWNTYIKHYVVKS
jgi:plasmid rolling circle replication initiator protein Rep